MWKTTEGSTGRLLQLCGAYFLSYVATGMLVKYFLGKPEHGFPGFNGIEFTTWNTIGGSILVLGTIMAIGWHKRLQSAGPVHIGPVTMPMELLYAASALGGLLGTFAYASTRWQRRCRRGLRRTRQR